MAPEWAKIWHDGDHDDDGDGDDNDVDDGSWNCNHQQTHSLGSTRCCPMHFSYINQ